MKRRMKLTPARLYGRFMGFMIGMTDKNAQDIIENQQKAIDYCMEENRVYKEIILELTGKKRIPLQNKHRRRLAVKAIALNIHILTNIVTIISTSNASPLA